MNRASSSSAWTSVRSAEDAAALFQDVEVTVVRLGFRILYGASRILDGQRMESKCVAQDQRFGNGRRRQIDPDVDAGIGMEPRAIDPRRLLRLAVPVYEDGVHNVERRAR